MVDKSPNQSPLMDRGALAFQNTRVRKAIRIFEVLKGYSALKLITQRFLKKYCSVDPKMMRLSLRGSRYPFYMRNGSSSDYDVFLQVFIEAQFGLLRNVDAPVVIIDCGANVGYTSKYFLDTFPFAKVIAIEPDPGNVKICRMNLEPYGDRCSLREAAIWDCEAKLSLVTGEYGDGREWATQVRAPRAGESPNVAAIDMLTLLSEANIQKVDILKVDIEGSEIQLFTAKTCQSWLGSVRNIAIELHGPDCERSVLDALKYYSYSLLRSGELHIFLNIEKASEERRSNPAIPSK